MCDAIDLHAIDRGLPSRLDEIEELRGASILGVTPISSPLPRFDVPIIATISALGAQMDAR